MLWRWCGNRRRKALPAAWLNRLLTFDPPMYWLAKDEIRRALKEYLLQELHELGRKPYRFDPSAWFRRYQPSQKRLARFRARKWPSYAPTFAIVIRIGRVPPAHVADTLRSVVNQVYPAWQAIGVTKRAMPSQIQSIFQSLAGQHNPLQWTLLDEGAGAERIETTVSETNADYVCLLDAGDLLEPQALYRLADIAIDSRPDLIYSDSVTTGMDPNDIQRVQARPDFSYDHFLSHPYISHLMCLKKATLDAIGGFGDWGAAGQEEELLLRFLEKAQTVTHIPEILYRQRLLDPMPAGASWERRLAPVRDHLRRLGCSAVVASGRVSGCRDVRFSVRDAGKVAVIIPTRNRDVLLRRCLDTIRATTARDSLSIYVVDHESTDRATVNYLRQISAACHILPYEGPFNFSRMMNSAVARIQETAGYYLFLNNDIEATRSGWLDHMLGHVQRQEIGLVGPLLIYPDGRIQHAGAVVGLYYGSDHSPKDQHLVSTGTTRVGEVPSIATRELSAVTGACMLMRADVFQEVGGFDEQFAVGFGDADLCLRVRARGYKVLLDAEAVLVHHESATRGRYNPHPMDTQLFRARYLQFILTGDPFYSPLLSRMQGHAFNPYARAPERVRAQRVRVVLPGKHTRSAGNCESDQPANECLTVPADHEVVSKEA
ncbi:hypothetical protein AYO40_01990 [Planctomycetaceae bacterium SCGC AG-212-D15]|nr:hypothetical protein AYO40_01990 [Planctomycetaceae bacterium SCGC AG-212-D15]